MPQDGRLYTLPVGVYPIPVRAEGLGMMVDEITIEEGQKVTWEEELPWSTGGVVTIPNGNGSPMANGGAGAERGIDARRFS